MSSPLIGHIGGNPSGYECLKLLLKFRPDKAAEKVLDNFDVLRYGRPLRSRMLVGGRGAGLAYDGLYYATSVTHNIKRGEYNQNLRCLATD